MSLKLVLALAFMTASTSVLAENWAPSSKILTGSDSAYQLKGTCERVSGERCFDLGDKPPTVYSQATVQEDDTSKPNYSKEQVTTCASADDCRAKMQAMACSTDGARAVYNLAPMEAYCTKLTGYQQRGVDVFILDQAKLSAHTAKLSADAVQAALEVKIRKAMGEADCGRRAIALVRVRNIPKNLSKAQQKALQSGLKDANQYLHNGSLALARDEVVAITPDGTVIQQADKDAVIALLDECLAAP